MSTARRSERADVAAVRVMVDALAPLAQAEIVRALDLVLSEELTACAQRLDDFGPLAAMLDQQALVDGLIAPGQRAARVAPTGDQRFPVIAAAEYDAVRPPQAPSSRALSERFGGSWRRACRAIWGLMPDGRYAGVGQPWPNVVRGRRRIRYSDEERIAAVRACAWRFGRRPSSSLYIAWSRRKRARARARGEHPRIPSYESMRIRYGGWAQTLAAAAITDIELAHARATLAARDPLVLTAAARQRDRARAAVVEPTAREQLDAVTDAELIRAGLDPLIVRSAADDGFAPLTLRDAAGLAARLGGSLDWLAGRQPSPGPLPAMVSRLDADAVRRARMDAGVRENALLAATGCSLSNWRRLMTGRNEPDLEIVVTLAGVLGHACGELCR